MSHRHEPPPSSSLRAPAQAAPAADGPPDGPPPVRSAAGPAGSPLRTERLLLRRWQEGDREPFAALNGDPEVMRHFPATLTRGQSDHMIERFEAAFDRDGYGLWALEVLETGDFIGFTGLNVPAFDAHFTPAVEVGWRLRQSAWGHGYASEAARASLDFAFQQAGLEEIVAMTTPSNLRSQAVMKRLGMTRDPAEDFDHPLIEPGHPKRLHILYRISAGEWARQGDR